jgi:hypothetical protein
MPSLMVNSLVGVVLLSILHVHSVWFDESRTRVEVVMRSFVSIEMRRQLLLFGHKAFYISCHVMRITCQELASVI